MDMVCGFAFTPDEKHVLLVRKNKPAWQAGLLNGVGGKVERGESIAAAMRREWDEEANFNQMASVDPEWTHFAGVSVPEKEVRVHFFRAKIGYAEMSVRDSSYTDVGELLCSYKVQNIHQFHSRRVIPNLLWLIPLALDKEVLGVVHTRMMAT